MDQSCHRFDFVRGGWMKSLQFSFDYRNLAIIGRHLAFQIRLNFFKIFTILIDSEQIN